VWSHHIHTEPTIAFTPSSWALLLGPWFSASALITDDSDQGSPHIYLLLDADTVGLGPALKRGRGIKECLERYPRVDWPEQEARGEGRRRGGAPTATKKVEIGRLGSAVRTLGGKSAVATVTEAVVEALLTKHPAGPPSPFGTTAGPRNGEIPSEDTILDAFKSFKPDTAPGISGWTHHLLAVAHVSDIPLPAARLRQDFLWSESLTTLR
jgi:hypothetical protein